MLTLNLWAYNSVHFGSARVRFCPDGTSTAGVLPHQIPWDRTLGFTDLQNLVTSLDPLVTASRTATLTLGILAHGQPDGIAILPGGRVLNSGGFSAHGSNLMDLNQILHRGARPLVILYSCAAAARHRDAPVSAIGLLEWMSANMENTRIVGFTRLLTLDGLRTVDQPEERFCLAPDVFETTEEYDYGRDIREQSPAASGGLALAGLDSGSAVQYLNGRRTTLSSGSTPSAGSRRRSPAGPRRAP